MVHLSQISFCFWLNATRDRLTIFSYLSSKGIIELMLQVVDRNSLSLTVGGNSRYEITQTTELLRLDGLMDEGTKGQTDRRDAC